MNFKEWWKRDGDGFHSNFPKEISEHAWNAAKEEILRIIFLNTKTNGKHTIDIDKTIKQIEEL